MNMRQHSAITALVTGVGAIIGQGIIKSLRNCHHTIRIVGMDRSDQSPGPFLCDSFYQKPRCEEIEPAYLAFWEDLLSREQVNIVLPGLEIDVFFLDQHRSLFENIGVIVVLNHSELINLSQDKWLLGEALQKHGLPKIPSVIPNTWSEAIEQLGEPPLLLKPRQSNGSRGIVRLHNMTDFLYWRDKTIGSWMLQRIVGTDENEYTVGIFGLGGGQALNPIIFRRKLSSAGNTLQAVVVNDPIIEKATEILTRLFQPLGPTNYQFRKEGETAFLLEINPRFSSSNSLRSAFGYNEAEMSVEYFLFKRQPLKPVIRYGVAWRYGEDYIIYDGHSV